MVRRSCRWAPPYMRGQKGLFPKAGLDGPGADLDHCLAKRHFPPISLFFEITKDPRGRGYNHAAINARPLRSYSQ